MAPHKPGHTKSRCSGILCDDYKVCKIKDKRPELKQTISDLQRELKRLQKNAAKRLKPIYSFLTKDD